MQRSSESFHSCSSTAAHPATQPQGGCVEESGEKHDEDLSEYDANTRTRCKAKLGQSRWLSPCSDEGSVRSGPTPAPCRASGGAFPWPGVTRPAGRLCGCREARRPSRRRRLASKPAAGDPGFRLAVAQTTPLARYLCAKKALKSRKNSSRCVVRAAAKRCNRWDACRVEAVLSSKAH